LEDQGEGVGIILKLIFKEEVWGMENNDSFQESKKRSAVVNKVMNFRAP
jgi:hypothetical protein